jgi:hypothetical protein
MHIAVCGHTQLELAELIPHMSLYTMLHYNLSPLRIPTCGLLFLAFGALAAWASILLGKPISASIDMRVFCYWSYMHKVYHSPIKHISSFRDV